MSMPSVSFKRGDQDEFKEIYNRLNAALSLNQSGLTQETRVQEIHNKATLLIFRLVHEILEGSDANAFWLLHEDLKSISLECQSVSYSSSEERFGLNWVQMKLCWVKSTLNQFSVLKFQ